MKSILKSLMSVAVAALAFTSCSNDATEDVMPNGGLKTLKVNATIDQTRTTLDKETHTDLTWAENEKILLYIGEEATEAHSIDPVGGTITGVKYNENDMVYACYSITDKPSKSPKTAMLNIPTHQKQSEVNVFDGTNMPMVAKGQIKDGSVSLAFQPIGCILVFNVYGPAAENEKIQSIMFEADQCGGYVQEGCDLTADPVQYKPYEDSKSVTVDLPEDAYAPIGISKPTNTKKGENQVYLVVAQKEYPAGSKFIVTTDAGTYTFTTKNALDCSKNARVVNLNLTNAAEMQPRIVVPDEPIEQSSVNANKLSIEGIQFENLTNEQIGTADVSAYSDATLEQKVDWITFSDNAELSNGILYYNLLANENVTERTAYIGIKCGGAQAAIAIKQLAKGKFVTTYVPANMNYENDKAVPSPESLDNGNVTLGFAQGTHSSLPPKYLDSSKSVHCYVGNTITITSSTSKILKIEFTVTREGTLSANVGKWSQETLTWTGESNVVVLTVGGSSQHRIKSMKIYYGEDNEPRIEVPTTVDKQPAKGGTFTIENIVFKNMNAADATTGVYSDADLTNSLTSSWLTIDDSNLASGTLSCDVAANETAESRTVYIGIKCADLQAAIAVTQKAQGAVDKYFVKVIENLDDWTGDYLIVYEADNKAFNGGLSGSSINGKNNLISVTITGQGILSEDATNAALVKITKKEGATDEYLLQTASGYFLYSSSTSSTDIKYNTSKETAAGHPHSISISSGSATIKSKTTSRSWAFNDNTSSGGLIFKYYKSGMKSVQLYKLQ